MLIRELAYDTEDDQLDLLIDSLEPEPAEVVAYRLFRALGEDQIVILVCSAPPQFQFG